MVDFKCVSFALLLFTLFAIEAKAQEAEKADSLFDAAKELHLENKLKKSRVLFHQAMDLYAIREDTVSQARVLTSLVSVYWRLGKYEEALTLAETGIRFARTLDDINSISMFQADIGTIRSRQGYYDKAYDHFTEALELAYETNDSENISLILNNFANLNRRIGKVQTSIKQFELSLKLIEDDTLDKAITLNSLGVSYLHAGRVNKALESFESSLQLRLKGEYVGDMAIIYNNLAMAHKKLGNNLLALDYFDKSLKVYKDNENEYGSASTLRNIGLIHFQQNDLERAEYYYLKSYKIFSESDDPSNLSSGMNALGMLYLKKNDHHKALDYFIQRLELENKVGNDRSIGKAYLDLGYYYISTKDNEKALSYFMNAYGISQPIENKSEHVLFLKNIGITYANMEKNTSALEYLNQALIIDKSINPELPNLRLIRELANVHHSLQSDSAYHYAELLYKTIENQRIQIGASGRSKRGYFSTFAPFYNRVASWYLDEKNDPEIAYRWIEAAKARAFIDDLAEASHNLDAHLDSELLNEKIKRSNRVVELSSKLDISTDEDEHPEMLQKLREAEFEYDVFLSRLRLTNPVYSRFDYPDPVSLKQAQEEIGSNTLILEYSFSNSKLISFAISQKAAKGWSTENPVLNGDENPQIDELVIQIRNKIKNKRPKVEINESARVLADILLNPASDMLEDAEKVIIVAEGMLAYLPFEALVWNGNYLIQDFHVKYSPSITALTLISDPEEEYEKDMLQVINPKFSNAGLNPANVSFQSLPSSKLEADAISPLFKNVTTLQGKYATERNIKEKNLSQYRYLHFATHGLLNEENPELSGLVLAQDENTHESFNHNDGFLRSAEIYALSIKADIVVLSSCESGLGKVVRGEGVLGLQRAFFSAGASTVIVSLWPVYDKSTSHLMSKFYEELIIFDKAWNNWPSSFQRWIGWDTNMYGYKAGAMRKAKLSLINSRKYNHPIYWASFVVVGK